MREESTQQQDKIEIREINSSIIYSKVKKIEEGWKRQSFGRVIHEDSKTK